MRSQFSLPEDWIYLNSGTMSFSPLSVQKAVQDHKQIIEQNPAQSYVSAPPQLWAVQKELAAFLKARPQDLFLRLNVTYAMNDFLMALKIPKGSEILISNLEYGAIENICRYKAEIEGHEVKVFSVPVRGDALEKLTEKSLLENFERHLNGKTKLVVISHVTTGTGFKFPMEKMAHICRSKKIIFAVDGAHGVGSVKLDFSKTEVDFYGSNLHKWMMGPKGTGFGWVAPQVRELLQPKFAGWTTYGESPFFSMFGEGDKWTYRWMLCCTHDFSDLLAIGEIVRFWNNHGAEKIFSAQRRLRDFAAKTISAKTGWPCISQVEESLRGSMVAFDLPDKIASRGLELMSFLREKHKLQTAVTLIDNQWCLRLAPHIYNTESEIEKAGAILESLMA